MGKQLKRRSRSAQLQPGNTLIPADTLTGRIVLIAPASGRTEPKFRGGPSYRYTTEQDLQDCVATANANPRATIAILTVGSQQWPLTSWVAKSGRGDIQTDDNGHDYVILNGDNHFVLPAASDIRFGTSDKPEYDTCLENEHGIYLLGTALMKHMDDPSTGLIDLSDLEDFDVLKYSIHMTLKLAAEKKADPETAEVPF
tara:strand:+ start:202 stop:798 length:597 start_codon:yes stop_codon:yes gene_type:complete